MTVRLFVGVVTLLLLLPRAYGSPLPPGPEVLERYIQVTGGREAYQRITSRISQGTFSIPAANIEGKLTLIQTTDAARLTLELPGIGVLQQGKTPDGIVWENNPVTGPRLVEGAEAQRLLQTLMLHPELQAESFYPTIETQGVEPRNGDQVYVVRFVSVSGEEETRYYSQETGLLLGVRMTSKTQLGEVAIVINIGQYREFDGLKLPVQVQQQLLGLEQSVTLTTIEHNKPIAADQLAPPEAAAQLIRAQATRPEPDSMPGDR